MTSNQGPAAGVTRRGVLAGGAAVGVGTAAVGVLAACGDQVIVSQPSAGEFRAFSAVVVTSSA